MEKWYEIKNKKDAAEIYIYDAIGSDYSAKKFIEEFNEIKANDINIHINSPGGSVFEGMAIYSIIVNSKKKVTTHIDGIAASIASVIALAGNPVKMAKNAQFMIHKVSNIVLGDSDDMKKEAEIMESLEKQMIDIYHSKTGIPEAEIKQMMEDETWMDGETALEKGFIDEVTAKKNIKNHFNLSDYGYTQNPKIKEDTDMEAVEKLENKITGLEGKITTYEDQIKTLKTDLEVEQTASAAKDTAIAELTGKVSNYEKADIEGVVGKAIADGKLLPAQKDWAVNLATESRESFDNYMASVKNVNLLNIENLDERDDPENPENITYDALMKDIKLYTKTKEENPELFNKLRDAWLKKK